MRTRQSITARTLAAALVAAALLAGPADAGDTQAKLREFVLIDDSERDPTPREATT